MGLTVIKYPFPDHHHFQAKELQFAAKALVMTEKDAVKCQPFAAESWYFLPVEAKLSDSFWQALWSHQQFGVMFAMRQIRLFICCVFLMAVSGYATEPTPKSELPGQANTLATNPLEVYWVFAGIVTNESGERYNYYFQMQRKNAQFHAIAALIDGQSKQVLLFEENEATIVEPDAQNWHVGNAFMQFNPINDSWVFGIKNKENKGFNFKIDLLEQAASIPVKQDLRSGVQLLVKQTSRLNGHLQMGELGKDQFVTAAKAWFKQVWVSQPQDTLHPLTGVLCQFNDGSGFYAVNLQEPDALRGAIAGWRDGQGKAIAMSQFISVKETKKGGVWHIRIPSPKTRLTLQDTLANKNEKHHLIAGLIEGEVPGFCTISRDEVG